jgi:hypothetical protein
MPSIKLRQTTSSGHAVTFAVLGDTLKGTNLPGRQGDVAQSLPVSGFMYFVCRYLVTLLGSGMIQRNLYFKESADNRRLLTNINASSGTWNRRFHRTGSCRPRRFSCSTGIHLNFYDIP